MKKIVWVAGGAVVALLATLIGFGGLSRTEATPLAALAGTKVDVLQYSVTVLDAELTDAIDEQYLEAESGETLVVVRMILENTSDRPISMRGVSDHVASGLITTRTPLLALPGIEPTRDASAWREDGSAGSVILQPGVPNEVRVAWPVSEDAVRSGTLRMDLYDARVTTGQILLAADEIIWRRGELAARISIDVGESS